MGVYIPGMEMPKSCSRCHISQPDGCGFICPIVTGKPIIDSLVSSRHARCPLVPVPPHGRLIDATERFKVQIYDDMTEDYRMVEMTIDDLLSQSWVDASAPTIIPADEGET